MLLTLKNLIACIIGPFLDFDAKSHKNAAIKTLILWAACTSPVIIATVLSPIPEVQNGPLDTFMSKLSDSFTLSEQYVYVTSFVIPFLYIIIDRFTESDESASPQSKFDRIRKRPFRGFIPHWLVGVLVFLIAIISYASTKTSPETFNISFLNFFLQDKAIIIYFVALYLWYLSILESSSISSNYVNEIRDDEHNFNNSFAERVSNSGEK
jgi:hypothetical protein